MTGDPVELTRFPAKWQTWCGNSVMNEDDKPNYFFDTSALVKHYHQETGTDLVEAAFADKGAAK